MYASCTMDGRYKLHYGWWIQVALWMVDTSCTMDGGYKLHYGLWIQVALWIVDTSCTMVLYYTEKYYISTLHSSVSAKWAKCDWFTLILNSPYMEGFIK
ncbi:hypothetical protein AVEN_65498-1 [Araneus ventricosus]|uniref:Uncharacterized protein n=1 Tax=Araneus ventricosus TaxID=182803 RepID=A0A4Y2JJP8_ARAVE|nr:hypothetical protein AVEN_65498-1 [Araneus ventricosus]